MGRPRRHRSASWTPASTWTTRRCRPRHRRAQDRRLGHRHRPDGRRRRHLAGDADRGHRAGVHLRGRAPGPRRPARTGSTGSPRAITADQVLPATSTATATPPTLSASSTTRTPRHPGRRQPEPRLHRRRGDAAVQGAARRRALRHRQPGHRGREQMPFVVEYREDVDLTPAGLPGDGRLRQHRHHRGRARLARRRHHRRQRHVRQRQDDGAAPGAKLVSARACTWGGGCTAAALTDGMVDLVVNRGVDVVNMSIGGLPALNDGNNARAMLYNRLINDYGVQMFISAGNCGPGLEHHRRPGRGHRRGQRRGRRQQGDLAGQLRLGGRKQNAAVPLLLARPARGRRLQAEHHRARLGDLHHAAVAAGRPVPEAGYALPPGYAMSTAPRWPPRRPPGGGAAAVRGEGQPAGDHAGRSCAGRSTRRRTGSTASPRPGRATACSGLTTPGRCSLLAWRLAATRSTRRSARHWLTTRRPRPGHRHLQPLRAYRQRARGRASSRRTPSRSPAQRAGLAVLHNLWFIGNDGTFAAPPVVLPLNKTVNVQVTARPTAGVHSAILRVDDPRPPSWTSRCSTPSWQGASRRRRHSRSPPPARSTATPPTRSSSPCPGATALQVNLSGIADGSQDAVRRIHPGRVPSVAIRQVLLHKSLQQSSCQTSASSGRTRTRCRACGN